MTDNPGERSAPRCGAGGRNDRAGAGGLGLFPARGFSHARRRQWRLSSPSPATPGEGRIRPRSLTEQGACAYDPAVDKTIVYVFTGTGNSLWAARELAGHVQDTEILPMAASGPPVESGPAERIGLSFPVHIWGLPRRVVRWTETLRIPKDAYIFALAVNAGQVARTLVQLEALLRRRRRRLSLGVSLALPSNYAPWGGPGTEEKQRNRFRAAREKIREIAAWILRGEVRPPEKGPWWQNVGFSVLYRMTYNNVSGMDKKFWVDSRCDHCRICRQVCPAGNVDFVQDKPLWRHDCEQCFACLQWCPRQAIQYGKHTAHVERYQNPLVSRSDIIRLWKSEGL